MSQIPGSPSQNGAAAGAGSIEEVFDNATVGDDIANEQGAAAAEKSVKGEFEQTAVRAMAGDCVVSLADEHGHFWETIWKHADNHEARTKRKNANVLLPNDTLRIPIPEPKQESVAAEQKHTFKLKNPPSVLRIKVLRVWEPMANEPYKLWLSSDEPPREGKTDAKGVIEEEIPARQMAARLEVGTALELYEYDLQLGWLDPIDTLAGVTARLNNVGYAAGLVLSFGSSNIIPNGMRDAIKLFQTDHGLKPTSVFDAKTRDKLYELGI